MTILVPDQGNFAQVEEALDEALLTEITSGMEPKLVRLTLPKFKMEHSMELPQTLSAMGMPKAFSKSDADFRGMDGKSCARGDVMCLYVSQVVHKAFIKVDEEGTEAAAATGVMVQVESRPPTPDVTLNIDRPFIFVIRHLASGAVLFMGRVNGAGAAALNRPTRWATGCDAPVGLGEPTSRPEQPSGEQPSRRSCHLSKRDTGRFNPPLGLSAPSAREPGNTTTAGRAIGGAPCEPPQQRR